MVDGLCSGRLHAGIDGDPHDLPVGNAKLHRALSAAGAARRKDRSVRHHRAECRFDAASLRTKAVRTDGGWLLNGTKIFTTNGFCRYPHHRGGNHAAWQGRQGARALRRRYEDAWIFRWTKPTSSRSIARHRRAGLRERLCCRRSQARQRPEQWLRQRASLMVDRSTGGARLGTGRAAYDAALRYAKERSHSGQPIGKFQAVQFKLVDMLAKLEQARIYTYHACALADADRPSRPRPRSPRSSPAMAATRRARWRCPSSAATAS